MDSRIPALVQPLLNHFLAQVQQALPGLLGGFYLHGSIALGAFIEQHSDIDFVAMISRRCTEDDVQRLAEIHRAVASQYPRWSLEGSYLPAHDLGKLQDAIAPSPNYYQGVLHPAGYHDINLVTWWVLKSRGIVLLGPDPSALRFDVDFDQLLVNMKHNLNTYWAAFTRKPDRMAWL